MVLLSAPALSIGEGRARELWLHISEYSELLCGRERWGRVTLGTWNCQNEDLWHCWWMERWKPALWSFIFEEPHSDCEMAVGSLWTEDEKSGIVSPFPTSAWGGWQCAGPTSPGASTPSCKMGAIEFPTKCYILSHTQKLGTLLKKAKHSTPYALLCPPRVPVVASCGAVQRWSRE